MSDDLLRDDAVCREAFRRGERWAMDAVYRWYVPLIYTVVSRGFGNFRGFWDPVAKDDAVQAIFAAAFEERVRLAYDGVHDYARFLRGLAQNVCRQILDKDRRFARTPESDPEADARHDVEARLLDKDALEACRRFRDGLETPLDKAVLDGYFARGEAEETLAEALGVTRYRLRKVIARLQKKMQRFRRDEGLE
jgi:DNA-directed RNA polymerase specialized sigma24 family protein